jgi:hypothetical protein
MKAMTAGLVGKSLKNGSQWQTMADNGSAE